MVSTLDLRSQADFPAYQGYLNENCATIAEVLKRSGYTTLMSGKWHVGGGYDLLDKSSWSPGNSGHPIPTQRGFDKFFGIVSGATNFFHPQTLMRDDELIDIDTTDFYLTDSISDNAVTMIEEAKETDKPFFIHVAYTAPHWPLHALEEDISNYEGSYLKGWDQLRIDRHEKLKGIGILDEKWEISPRHSSSDPWEKTEKREWEDLRMAVYAAMIDRMDQAIGRVLAQLRKMGAFDNTLIFFLSDNGASAEIMVRTDGHDPNAPPGSGPSYLCLGPGWSTVSNTPFRRHKTWVHEGGCATPFIAHWPKGIKDRGQLRRAPGHVIDVVPTILELAGVKKLPADAPKAPGHSLLPVFARDGPLKREYLWWFHGGHRAIRVGDWKLVAAKGDPWELYNLGDDRTEMKNLASSNPDKAKELERAWTERMGEFRKLASGELPAARK